MRTFLADFIRASRLNVMHQRPDIRLQPDLNMSDIAILLHTWRHPYKSFSLVPRSGKRSEEWRAVCLQIDRRYRNQGSESDRGVLATECGRCVLHGRGEGAGERVQMPLFWAWGLSISRSGPCRHCPQDAPQILGIGSGTG